MGRLSPHYRELLPETLRQSVDDEGLAALLDGLRPLAQVITQMYFSTPPEQLFKDSGSASIGDDTISDQAEALAFGLNISMDQALRLANINRQINDAPGGLR